MSFTAGEIRATLGGDFDPREFLRFDAAMKHSAAEMQRTETAIAGSSKRSAGHFGGVATAAKVGGLAAAGAFVGVGAVLLKSVNSARQFEASMRNVNTIAKLSDQELDKLGKTVLKLAADTGQAPKTLADGLYDIVSAGYKGADALNLLEVSAKSASAGLTTTEVAGRAITSVLNAYGLKASEAAEVSDILFRTVDLGAVTFEELAQNLGDVLPFASPLKVGLDEVGAAIATITSNGTPAVQAFTQVKGVFSQLLSPSEALAAAVTKTGAASAESLVKADGLQGALKKLVGTTDGSKASLSQLFPNVEALSAALNLTGDNAKKADGFLKDIGDSAGATSDAFEEQSKSFEVQAQRFKAALDAAFITIGQELLPKLTPQLKKLSDAIANGLQDGSIEAAANDVVNAFKSIGDGVDFMVDATKQSIDTVLGIYTTYLDAVLLVARAVNKIPGVDIDTSSLERGIDKFNEFREGLRDNPEPVKLQVEAQVDNAVAALRRVENTPLEEKTVEILGRDTDARSKLRALIKIGIPEKDAFVMAQVGDALAGINSVQGALSLLPALKRIHIEITQSGGIPNALKGPLALTPRPQKGRASGRGAEGEEVALVGEGRVPREYIVDPNGGTIDRVDSPQIRALDAGEYVIPVDPAMRGRSLGLFGDLARELGIPGFEKGRGSKKPKAKAAAKKPSYKVPDRIALGGLPFGDVENDFQQARDNYQGIQKDVAAAEKDVGQAQRKVRDAKKKETKEEARRELREAERVLKARKSLESKRRKQHDRRRADWLAAKKTADQDATLVAEIDLARDEMEGAAKRDDSKTFEAARGRRKGKIGDLIALLQRALGQANPKSAYARELRARLSRLGGSSAVAGGPGDGGELLDTEQDAMPEVQETDAQREAREAAEQLADTGMTATERQRLKDLEAQKALAALTEGLEDDKVAATNLEAFLSTILGYAQVDPARGGSETVAAIAQQVKGARDELAALTSGRGTVDDPDVQAQLDQANIRAEAYRQENQANIAALAAFGSSGSDIGTGRYGNALDAARGTPTVIVQTLHPGDPRTLRAVGDAATAGMNNQSRRGNPPERLGI